MRTTPTESCAHARDRVIDERHSPGGTDQIARSRDNADHRITYRLHATYWVSNGTLLTGSATMARDVERDVPAQPVVTRAVTVEFSPHGGWEIELPNEPERIAC